MVVFFFVFFPPPVVVAALFLERSSALSLSPAALVSCQATTRRSRSGFVAKLPARKDDDDDEDSRRSSSRSLVRMDDALLEQLENMEEAREEDPFVIDFKDGTVAYEPRDGRRPWAAIHFVGGAGLGTYPAAAYGYFLSALADELGVGCVATPFDLGLDHSFAASDVRAKFADALTTLTKDRAWPENSPIFGLGHSLGAKLLLLRKPDYERITCLASNNFGIEDSARLLKEFLRAMSTNPQETVTSLLDFVLMAAEGFGLQVSPTPQETLDALKGSYVKGANNVAFIQFDKDTLDSTNDLANALQVDDVRKMPGGHLSCVYVPPFNVGDPLAVQDVVSAVAEAFRLPINRGSLPEKSSSSHDDEKVD